MQRPTYTSVRVLVALTYLLMTSCLQRNAMASWWNPWELESKRKPPALKGETVKVYIKGIYAFSERRLRLAIEEQLERIRSRGLTQPNADDAAYYLAVFYHQNGYASAEVTWKIEKEFLTLSVSEGPLVQLRSTGIEGNQRISSSQLLSLLVSPTVDRLRLPESGIPFVKDELEMGASRIVDYYQSEGFLDATVVGPEIEMTPQMTGANVLITVNEGRQYRFGSIRLLGPLVVPEADIRKVIAPFVALPFTVPRQLALQNALQKFYANLSHYQARVTVSANPSDANSE